MARRQISWGKGFEKILGIFVRVIAEWAGKSVAARNPSQRVVGRRMIESRRAHLFVRVLPMAFWPLFARFWAMVLTPWPGPACLPFPLAPLCAGFVLPSKAF